MTIEALNVIDDAMAELGIEYAFGEYKGKNSKDQEVPSDSEDGLDEEGIIYPYFTGEYQEVPSDSEDGSEETSFILNGFSRTSKLELEEAKAKIKEKFHPTNGLIVTTPTGSVVTIFYEIGFFISIEDAELERIQINLSVKEWSVK